MRNVGKMEAVNFNWVILGAHKKEIKAGSLNEFYKQYTVTHERDRQVCSLGSLRTWAYGAVAVCDAITAD